MASRGAPQPRQGISAILNNIQVIKDQFRKQQKRVDLFEQKLKKSHRSFGNEIFKVRHNQYFDEQKQHRYKTPHLKLREIHRSLRGLITRTQKEKDKHDLLHPPGQGPDLPTFNDIKNYPDTRQPLKTDQMIENVNKMIDEEAKYQDEEWVKEMSQSGSDQSEQMEQTIFKKEVKHEFKFSLSDKLKSALAERVSKQLEHEELERLKMHHLHVQDMLISNVSDLYSNRQFKQVMSVEFKGSMLHDVATRLMQQFKAQLKDGVPKPVPNLGQNLKSIRADSKEMADLFENLLFVLRTSDREQYMALRDGKLSLNQICRNLCQQQFGKTYTVMDDIIDEGKLLKKPSKYVVAACNQLQLESKLLKHAEKRGVDKKLLKDTAPKISLQAKCIRSIHSKPARRRTEQKVDHVDKTGQVLQTKETQDEAKKLDLIQRQAEKWGNFYQNKGIMTEKNVKMGKKRRYEQVKSIESRFSFKLPQELHESLTRDYKTEYSRQIKLKTERAAALRPWRAQKSQNLTDADVIEIQTIVAPEKIIYESMPESFKEKLEDCQEALFLKRIYEDNEGCVLQMPVRFAFSVERQQIQVQHQVQASPQLHFDMIRNPSDVMLAESEKHVDQINEASNEKSHCQTLGEEDLSPKGPYITAEGPQTVEASCDSFQKIQIRKSVDLSPLHSVRVKQNLLKRPQKTAVILKAKEGNSSSTEEEKFQSSKLLNSNSIVKQLLELENQEYITERFRPKSAICPTSAVQRHRLLGTRKTELQCNNIADLKVNKDHQQFLMANMRQGAYCGSLIQNSFSNTSKNPTPKQATELIAPFRHIVMQGQMMNKFRPSTVRPRTVLDPTQPESMARGLTQGRNTPCATSSIKDYELKTSQVPSSVVNWYKTNIVRSHDQRSPAMGMQKSLVVKTAPKIGRLMSAKNGDQQRTLGSYDSNLSLENSSAPFVKGFVIKNQETPSLKEEEFIVGSAAVTAVSGFNWLTGSKMSIGKNISIPSKLKVTDPILKKKRILQQITTLNDFVDYPVAKQPKIAHLIQIDAPDHSTELKIKQSLNLRSENQSVIDLC